ncbi:hypothetical protein Cni_G08922 [Canna indica]|uniref:Calcium uniporter protein C-terminal domain-containing protein n=1 Tax=Canna indica TaxID=4628 RepID=A0AAQ3Q790_9LILI|nr:hypothetical protein Cni_G08922 [Canna indica]
MAALRRTLAHRFSQITKIASPDAATARASHPALLRRTSGAHHSEPGRFVSSFLQKRPIFQPALPPDRFSLPVGDRLVERIGGRDHDRLRLDLILPLTPPPAPTPAAVEGVVDDDDDDKGVTLAEVRKLARASRMEAVRARLRATGKSCVSHSEFVRICCEACGADLGAEVARSLDETGVVIVWGSVVFLRPEEVAKAIESAIPQGFSPWSDSQSEELREMEKAKAEIDRSAAAHVKRELWCGLGLLAAQTAAFMRLTFWELTWDVMEPICFYVTSVYFMAGYAFFLRTSKEPSFESFFDSRFASRQKRLMKARNFDVGRFNELRRASPAYRELTSSPSYSHCLGGGTNKFSWKNN